VKYLLDVNALVALGFLQHEFHERIAGWVRALTLKGALDLTTCSITELGFVRVLAQAPLYGFSVAQARSLLLRLKASDVLRFTFIPDDHDVSHIPSWDSCHPGWKDSRRVSDPQEFLKSLFCIVRYCSRLVAANALPPSRRGALPHFLG
jgi:hypothetical protein